MLLAKIATIRGKQISEKTNKNLEIAKQENKQYLQMELERLKGLGRYVEQRKKTDEIIQYGRDILIEQIKYREMEKQKQKEEMYRDRDNMNQKLKELDEENEKKAKIKTEHEYLMGLEVLEANKNFIKERERKKLLDQELDRKILEFNIKKEKREYE
jgi:hypothetical protein